MDRPTASMRSITASAADLSALANLVVRLGAEGFDFRAKAARLAMSQRPELRLFLQPLMAEAEASELDQEISHCYQQLVSTEHDSQARAATLHRLRQLQEMQAAGLAGQFEASLPLQEHALDNAIEEADALLARYDV